MALYPKKLELNFNKQDVSTILEAASSFQEQIKLMERLISEEVNDEEFLTLIKACYQYNKWEILKDIEENASLIFGSDQNIKYAVIDTNYQLLYSSPNDSVNFKGYVVEEFDDNKKYTVDDLRELIREEKLILDDIARIKHHDEPLVNPELYSGNANSFFIGNISLSDLGIYKDWFIKILKRVLTKEQIRKDIISIIENAKEEIQEYVSKAKIELELAEIAVANNRKRIIYFDSLEKRLDRNLLK